MEQQPACEVFHSLQSLYSLGPLTVVLPTWHLIPVIFN